jgi:PAS domain S-box-containing protein
MHPHTSDPTTLPAGIFNPPEDALALSGEASAPGAGADEKKPVIWQDSCIGRESAMSPAENNAHPLELLKQRSMAFEHIEDGIIVTSLEGVILDWNMGAQRLFGYSREEMLGKTPAVLHRPCDAEQLTDSINATASEHGRWKGDIHFVRKDGTSGICETTTVPMRDEQGRIFATLGINHDVTAQ